MRNIFKEIKIYKICLCLLGSFILAFGLYNIHSFANVTEGGVLGCTLLLDYWPNISPSISGMIFNLICYLLGWHYLGKNFIIYSIIASCGFSFSYAIYEQFPRLWPQLANQPLLAAILGALFVGIGVGISVKAGGAPGGDDALAMALSHRFNLELKTVYLTSDLIILFLSLSYIPLNKIIYSLITVILSGQIIQLMQNIHLPKKFNLDK